MCQSYVAIMLAAKETILFFTGMYILLFNSKGAPFLFYVEIVSSILLFFYGHVLFCLPHMVWAFYFLGCTKRNIFFLKGHQKDFKYLKNILRFHSFQAFLSQMLECLWKPFFFHFFRQVYFFV